MGVYIMKALFFAFLAAFSSFQAVAADSSWLLCDNGSLVVSVYEHRAADGEHRITSLSLIFGGYTLMGSIGDELGWVRLAGINAENTSFVGTMDVDYVAQKLNLNGELVLNGEKYQPRAELACKEMQGALGQ